MEQLIIWFCYVFFFNPLLDGNQINRVFLILGFFITPQCHVIYIWMDYDTCLLHIYFFLAKQNSLKTKYCKYFCTGASAGGYHHQGHHSSSLDTRHQETDTMTNCWSQIDFQSIGVHMENKWVLLKKRNLLSHFDFATFGLANFIAWDGE